MTTKTDLRVQWLTEHKKEILSLPTQMCPSGCRSKCGNGATCRLQSGGGWGYWVWALRKAGIPCSAKNYWSGSNPTPSTSIRRQIADYITLNAPIEIR